MFWPRNFGNSIDKLLEKPDITLNQVLQDSAFTNSIRSPSKTFTNYLLSENNLKQLIIYSLTNDFELSKNTTENGDEKVSDSESKRKEFNRLQRCSVLALTNQSKQFQNELLKNEILKEKLSNFPTSKYSSDPKISGHYSRIVETLVRSSSGKYLYELPNVIDYLIKDINVLPIRELFIVLFCEFTTTFIKCSSGSKPPQNDEQNSRDSLDGDDDDDDNSESEEQTTKEERDAFFKKLLDNDHIKTSASTFFVFSAINGIFTQNIEYVRYFATSEFFKETLNIATSPDQKQLGAIEAFKVASRIIEWTEQNEPISTFKSDEISNIISEIEPKFDLPNRSTVDGVTAYACNIFILSAAHLITYLFDEKSNTFLNSAILQAFKKLEWSDQIHLVNNKDLVRLIISSFQKVDEKDENNTSLFVKNDNGHISELADYLNTEFAIRKDSGNIDDRSKCFESEEWKNFVNTQLNPHMNQRETFDSVRSSSDSSGDTEEVEVEYEDEEDEEEEFNEPLDMSSSDDEEDEDESDEKNGKKKVAAELHSASDDDDEKDGKEVDQSQTKVTKTDTSADKNKTDDKESNTENN